VVVKPKNKKKPFANNYMVQGIFFEGGIYLSRGNFVLRGGKMRFLNFRGVDFFRGEPPTKAVGQCTLQF